MWVIHPLGYRLITGVCSRLEAAPLLEKARLSDATLAPD